MNRFDSDEKNIREAFSQINVDSTKLNIQIKKRLNANTQYVKPKKLRFAIIIAAMISVMFVATATAASLGSFDWFIQKFNPSFGEIVEPIGVYCEDQGIKMEIIAAQKYGNMAVVYLSLQDISGQNRLTERTDFREGFSVKMNMKPHNVNKESAVTSESVASMGYSQKTLYFDNDSNTVYYEFNITTASNSPLYDPLTLGSFLIYFDEISYMYEPVSINLSGILEIEGIPLEEKHVWSGSNDPNKFGGLTAALNPGYYGLMPHGEQDQWISNAGIINDKLHIQIGRIFNTEFGSSDVQLYLKSQDGELISYDYEVGLLGDNNKRILNREKDSYDDAVYKYNEFVFTVNEKDLDGYSLCFTGSFYTGVEGRWKVAECLSDTSRQMRILKNDISVDGYLFEHITLSPLGLQVIGSYNGEKCEATEMPLAIETSDGSVIHLVSEGGSHHNQAFNLSWKTQTPLNVTAATAIIINGECIPIISENDE